MNNPIRLYTHIPDSVSSSTETLYGDYYWRFPYRPRELSFWNFLQLPILEVLEYAAIWFLQKRSALVWQKDRVDYWQRPLKVEEIVINLDDIVKGTHEYLTTYRRLNRGQYPSKLYLGYEFASRLTEEITFRFPTDYTNFLFLMSPDQKLEYYLRRVYSIVDITILPYFDGILAVK
jgi:hypothetical protein